MRTEVSTTEEEEEESSWSGICRGEIGKLTILPLARAKHANTETEFVLALALIAVVTKSAAPVAHAR